MLIQLTIAPKKFYNLSSKEGKELIDNDINEIIKNLDSKYIGNEFLKHLLLIHKYYDLKITNEEESILNSADYIFNNLKKKLQQRLEEIKLDNQLLELIKDLDNHSSSMFESGYVKSEIKNLLNKNTPGWWVNNKGIFTIPLEKDEFWSLQEIKNSDYFKNLHDNDIKFVKQTIFNVKEE